MNKNVVCLFLGIMLVGCNEPTRDKEYYLSHRDELKQKITQCGKNPGELANTPNCINAKDALFKIMMTEGKGPPRF